MKYEGHMLLVPGYFCLLDCAFLEKPAGDASVWNLICLHLQNPRNWIKKEKEKENRPLTQKKIEVCVYKETLIYILGHQLMKL